MEKLKEIKIDFMYKVPSNQTPEELVRMDSSYAALKQEIKRLNEVLALQSSKIEIINNKISKSQQQNFNVKSEILRLKNSKKANKSVRLKKKRAIDENSSRETAQIFQDLDFPLTNLNLQRMGNLEKMLRKNDEDLLIFDKRLQIAETLLGLKLE